MMQADPHRLHRRRGLALAMAAVLLTGCAPVADQPARAVVAPGPPPVLVPLDGILAQADSVGSGAAAVPSVAARAERLRNRATVLRRP